MSKGLDGFNAEKYREGINYKPKTVNDVHVNFEKALANYGLLLDDIVDYYEEVIKESGGSEQSVVKKYTDLRDEIPKIKDFLLQKIVDKYSKQVGLIKGRGDDGYEISYEIKENKSVDDEYFSADVTLKLGDDEPIVGDCVFQKGAWPSDKTNTIPVSFLLETQRTIRDSECLLWMTQKDMI